MNFKALLKPSTRVHPDHALMMAEAAAHVAAMAVTARDPFGEMVAQEEAAEAIFRRSAELLAAQGVPTDERQLTYSQMKAHALANLKAAVEYLEAGP